MRVSPLNNNFVLNKNLNINNLKYNETEPKDSGSKGKDEVSFKKGNVIDKFFGEQYAIKLMDKKWVRAFSEKLLKLGGNMTEHMATLGSLITSGVYVTRTLTNDNLDNSKKKTLAINQGLCFIVPTICAYTVNRALGNFNKGLEYMYGGIQNQKVALGNFTKEHAAEMSKLTGERLKGFKTLASLMTFTLIYRYATPVIITPIANWIGEKLEQRKTKETKLAQISENQVHNNAA